MRRLIAAVAAALFLSGAAAPVAAAPDAAALPLSLDAAMTLALRGNPAFLSAHQDVVGAVAALRESEGPHAPRVALSDNLLYATPVAELNTPFGVLPFAATPLTNVPQVTVSYTVFDGGVTAARVSRAAADLAAANAREAAARATLLDQTAGAYYALAAAVAAAEVADRALGVAQQRERDAEERLQAGQVPRADVLRAQTDVAGDRMQQIDAHGAVALAQTALDRVMNVPLDRRYVPADPIDAPVPPLQLDVLLAAARTGRPELGAAQAALDAATFALHEVRAAKGPRVTVFVADGNVQPAVAAGYRNQFSSGLDLVWTLFDRGVDAARVDAAQAGIIKAQLALASAKSDVEEQVRDAVTELDEARARVASAEHYVSLAAENLRLAQVRYNGGVGTLLEVQSAELSATTAQRALVEAQVDARRRVVHARFAAGLL